MSGHDLIGIASTGSGKTLAFGLPALRHIEAQKVRQIDARGHRGKVARSSRRGRVGGGSRRLAGARDHKQAGSVCAHACMCLALIW